MILKKSIVFFVLIVLLSIVSSADDLRDEVVYSLLKKSKNNDIVIKNMQEKISSSNAKLKALEEEIKELKMQVNYVDISKSNKVIEESLHDDKVVSLNKDKKSSNVSNHDTTALIVTSWALNVRAKPNKSSKCIAFYKMGEVLTVSKHVGKWYKTENGYVKDVCVEAFDKNKIMNATVSHKNMNLRSSPVIMKNIVGEFKKGHRIRVYPVVFNKDWYKIVDTGNYIHKNGIRISK